MLHPSLPVSLVRTTVGPKHFTESMPHIVVVCPYVVVTALPPEMALAMLLVVEVLTLVLVAVRIVFELLPRALAMLLALVELAYVDAA